MQPRFSAQKVIKSTHRPADPGSCETLLHYCKPTHKRLGQELSEPKGTYEDAHLTPDHSSNIWETSGRFMLVIRHYHRFNAINQGLTNTKKSGQPMLNPRTLIKLQGNADLTPEHNSKM